MTSSSEQSERLPISLPDSVGDRFREILGAPMYEYRDGRGALWTLFQIEAAMHRVREETIESGDWVPMPKNADQAVAMWLIGEAWVRANAPDRLSPLPTPPQKDLESR